MSERIPWRHGHIYECQCKISISTPIDFSYWKQD